MKLLILLLIFLCSAPGLCYDKELHSFYNQHWKITKRTNNYIENGEIIVDANVKDVEKNQNQSGKQQEFTMHVAAMHPKACGRILRKLSMFEKFETWVSFIKSSVYDEGHKLWTIKADHALLPYPMLVHIIVDRPKTAKRYPFTFPTGMFAGLKGHFIIKEHKNKCVFYATSYWSGKHTGIPNFVIDLFSETLTKLGGEIIFRKIK